MSSLLLSLVIMQMVTSDRYNYLYKAEDAYNPLDALDWSSIDLDEQISDLYRNASNSFEMTGFDIMGFEIRTYDATGNNLENIEYGATHSQTPRCLPPDYEDGIDALAGSSRMNAREISNVLAKQIPEDDPKFVNDRDLTQFAWQWGQFIDHDITLIPEERIEDDPSFNIDIYVPCSDPVFDVEDTCDADEFIELFRTLPFPGTGTDASNPRQQKNEVTSFVDASMIYGSDQERAEALRSFKNGELLVTEDNFLPPNFEEDPLENEPNDDSSFPIGGDVRPSEQLGLLVMHTIWVRFHNLIAEEVAISIDGTTSSRRRRNRRYRYGRSLSEDYSSSDLSDEERDEMIYQYTKLIVTAIVQKITYKDWLPALFGPTAINKFLGEFSEYDETINPGACLIFSSAGFRLGHTLLPNFLPLRDEQCRNVEFDENTCPECNTDLGGIELRDVFFVPERVEDNDGFLEAILNGMTCTLANEIDVHITEGVRNFLFESAIDRETGDRLFGNLDLIAINFERGREQGLPDYNTVREGLGLDRLNDFSEMTSDAEVAENFEVIYGDINDVDLFLAPLAEDHFDDGSFGETTSAIVLGQFKRFRDGDRFWYQRYIQPGELLDFINSVTLKSVIELTTDIKNIDLLDTTRNNIFRNKRAIPIFDEGHTFQAQTAPQKSISNQDIQNHPKSHYPQQQPHHNYYHSQPADTNPGSYVIQLSNLQMVIMISFLILTVGCTCYLLHQCQKSQINRYSPVKYNTETELDSDREKLKA